MAALAASLPSSLAEERDYKLEGGLYAGSTSARSAGRSAVYGDPITSAYANGTLTAPKLGELAGVNTRGEEQHWRGLTLDADGVLQDDELRGGVAFFTYESPKSEVAILQASGNSETIVNGVLRGGDGYGKGWMILPVELKRGTNEFWYRVSRGRNKSITLSAPPKDYYLTDVDALVPDFLTDEVGDKWAAVRIVNATSKTLDGFRIVAESGGQKRSTDLSGSVMPMTTRKMPFTVFDGDTPEGEEVVKVSLYRNDQLVDTIDLTVEVKPPSKNYRITFISDIDGSVQYYAVREGGSEPGKKPALFVSTHGAAVMAIRHAGSYQSKDWGHLIAPTNRREFGFDWQEWGMWDALEVIRHAESRYETDPDRTYLTGHSMGGHGAWYLGAVFPDRWGAIAPKAAWRSFYSYGGKREEGEEGRDPTPMETLFNRASNPSRTLEMSKNYLQHGVYIAHGDLDNNVPVEQARFMHKHLAEFHRDIAYREEPGGGHTFGNDRPPIFNFFRDRPRKDIRDLGVMHFRSASPGLSSTSRYITLYQQEESYEFCGVVATQSIRTRRQRRNNEDIDERTISIETENLKIFKVDLEHCAHMKTLALEVDGQAISDLAWPGTSEVWLEKEADQWSIVETPTDTTQKNPVRYGGFKDAFQHRMVFVYATGGNQAENQWAINKARFDAETFYYRGNGSIDVIPDTEFTLNGYPDRSVILYGNRTTNKAWKTLLSDSPVQVSRNRIEVGDRVLKGDDLGIYLIRPRADSAIASVGVVAGTGSKGQWAVDPNRYFVSGTAYPDFMVITPEMYTKGMLGIPVAGYFDNDWNLDESNTVWAE